MAGSPIAGVVRGFGGTGALFGPDLEDQMRSGYVVRDEDLEARNQGYLNQLDHLFRSSLGTGRRFARDWRGTQADAERRSQQEIGAIDPFFSGAYEAQQAGQRRNLGLAYDRATALGQDYLTNRLNANRVAGLPGFGGGNSSYANRQALRGATDINLQSQLALAEREREDAERAIAYRLGSIGARQGIQDATTRRTLVPWDVQQSLYTQNLGNRATLGNIFASNRDYYTYQEPALAEQIADAGDSVYNALQTAATMYAGGMGGAGGMMGGMGGAGAGASAAGTGASTASIGQNFGNWLQNVYGQGGQSGGGNMMGMMGGGGGQQQAAPQVYWQPQGSAAAMAWQPPPMYSPWAGNPYQMGFGNPNVRYGTY